MGKRQGDQDLRVAGEFETIRQIRGANRATGQVWIGQPGVRLHDVVYAGRYFVASEPLIWPFRAYSVHVISDDHLIYTVGSLYSSARAAHRAAERFAEVEG
jgi:hypothetical protein